MQDRFPDIGIPDHPSGFVYELYGSYTELRTSFHEYIDTLFDTMPGGDDSVYDYWPGGLDTALVWAYDLDDIAKNNDCLISMKNGLRNLLEREQVEDGYMDDVWEFPKKRPRRQRFKTYGGK
jgi:hypothetical protein